MRHYNPHEYSDDDRSEGRYYSSESPDETDSEYDDYRERGWGPSHAIYHAPVDRGAVYAPDSESYSEGGTPDSTSETETDDYSDRPVLEGYESGSTYDREDHHSYGDPLDDWEDYEGDEYGYDGVFLLPRSHPFRYSECLSLPCVR